MTRNFRYRWRYRRAAFCCRALSTSTSTRRNTRSDFFLSIQVSYPNEQDMQRARRNGWQPGGSIMIHGLPNDPRHTPDYYASQDWTDGCIAVTNADMVEIWMMTSDNVRIDIQP